MTSVALLRARGRIITISHIRAGAPPVINPLETQFSENAVFSLAHNFTLMLGSAGPNMTFFNLTNPAVGDWFIAAHLPKDDGKIEPKGFSSSCSYFFQPQMFVRRVIDMPVLEPGVPLQQTVSSPDKPAVLNHIRAGAPPVINPLETQFSENAAFSLAHNFTLMLGSAGPNMTFFNLTNPAVGDWFIAAHLPKDDGKIEPKGFSSSCSYFFQPQMFVRRVNDMPVLEPGVPLQQTVSSPDKPAVLKVFIPAYTAELTLRLGGCRTENSTADSCPLVLTLGSAALTRSSPKTVNCSGQAECLARLHSPPWESWVRITVESLNSNLSTSFQITAALIAGCKPKSGRLFGDFSKFNGVNGTGLFSNATSNATLPVDSLLNSTPSGDSCLRRQPVFKEDVDVVSVRFALINGPNISISSQAPTLISLNLNSGADSGGTLVLDLRLNQVKPVEDKWRVRVRTSLTHGNATVVVSFSHGYSLRMNGTSPEAALHIPFPETALWYLTLHTVCPADASECGKVSGTVLASSLLSACVNDCGTYGECRLLRSYGYLYAACTCKAGESLRF
ncbi:UNVERIFIED_CONTAM: hypothetical protein FKN15_034974 [Acipenser sinensis]